MNHSGLDRPFLFAGFNMSLIGIFILREVSNKYCFIQLSCLFAFTKIASPASIVVFFILFLFCHRSSQYHRSPLPHHEEFSGDAGEDTIFKLISLDCFMRLILHWILLRATVNFSTANLCRFFTRFNSAFFSWLLVLTIPFWNGIIRF